MDRHPSREADVNDETPLEQGLRAFCTMVWATSPLGILEQAT